MKPFKDERGHVENQSTVRVTAIVAVVGMVLWFVASLVSGLREPWDGSLYWVVVYPLAILVCALFGYFYPRRPWRWPLVLFAAQFIAMCLRNGEIGNLWPLGIVFSAVLALPGIAAARFAARFSRSTNTA